MFHCYEVSLQLVRAVRDVEPRIKAFDAALADQLHRATMSVTLNVAEGSRSSGGNKRRHFELAHGSANEVKACLDLAEAFGWLDDTSTARELLDRELAMLWRLTHPRP